MARRTQVQAPVPFLSTSHICRESLRILLNHPSHFHFVSVFLFSPYPASLFLSYHLKHHFSNKNSSLHGFITNTLVMNGVSLPETFFLMLSNSTLSFIMCFPLYITFSLLAKAAVSQAVKDSYDGIKPSIESTLHDIRGGLIWAKMIHTCVWEKIITVGFHFFFLILLKLVFNAFFSLHLGQKMWVFWAVLGVVCVFYCIGLANIIIVCNLAGILPVLEADSYGFEAMIRANNLIRERRQTALIMALITKLNLGFIECLFEHKMSRSLGLWEVPMLVSMYSLVLVMENIMTAVFHRMCRVWDMAFELNDIV